MIFATPKFIMQRLICLSILMLCNLLLMGQTRLSIVDSVTGKPIPYAHIVYGNHEGKYTDEEGIVTIPEEVDSVTINHITYESKELDRQSMENGLIAMVPIITELRPAVVFPRDKRKETIGYASAKRESVYGGRNGFNIAEFFAYSPEWEYSPLISSVSLNLNTVNLKRNVTTTTVNGVEYTDGVMRIAKLRIDLRGVDTATGGPGESLINGGVIYSIKDKFNLRLHKLCKVALPGPELFPESGVFVVIEWIVTEDVRVQDSVSPSIWCTRAVDNQSSWMKWPVGTPWRRKAKDSYDNSGKSFCIGLEIMM